MCTVHTRASGGTGGAHLAADPKHRWGTVRRPPAALTVLRGRRDKVLLTRARAGMDARSRTCHLHKRRGEEGTRCPCCDGAEDTPAHMLACPAIRSHPAWGEAWAAWEGSLEGAGDVCEVLAWLKEEGGSADAVGVLLGNGRGSLFPQRLRSTWVQSALRVRRVHAVFMRGAVGMLRGAACMPTCGSTCTTV